MKGVGACGLLVHALWRQLDLDNCFRSSMIVTGASHTHMLYRFYYHTFTGVNDSQLRRPARPSIN